MTTPEKEDDGLTGYRSTAKNLLRGRRLIKSFEARDGGFSLLLASHSESKCANKLDIVYALLGVLPKFAPALRIPVDYAATTIQLYIRATDQMETPARSMVESGARSLKLALDLTWSNIIVAMQETENHLNVSQCHFNKLLAHQSDFSIIDECCLTGGDPTHKPPQFYTCNLRISYATRLSFREVFYTDIRRQNLSKAKEPGQRPVWAIHGSIRCGDLLLECVRISSHDFASVFRSGTDETWPCIGCAWKPTSPESDDTPADSRAIREYIVSSSLFLHAYLQVEWKETCLILAPSRLFALMQGYKVRR